MFYDLDAVRAQFPALAIRDDGRRRIYLDNPAGTQVPNGVAAAMSDCLLRSNANLGGYFPSSVAADQVVGSAREAMANLLNASSAREIVFGQNMTTITMHMSRSIGGLFAPGDEIVLSRMDHDANVWPWVLMARDLDLKVRWLPFSPETFEFDLDDLDDLLTDRTRLICVGGASNLTGTINDIASICAVARDAGVITYIDAVQSVLAEIGAGEVPQLLVLNKTDIADPLQGLVTMFLAGCVGRVGEHERERPQPEVFTIVLVEFLGASEQRHHVDDVVSGVRVDIDPLTDDRFIDRLTEVFLKIMNRHDPVAIRMPHTQSP